MPLRSSGSSGSPQAGRRGTIIAEDVVSSRMIDDEDHERVHDRVAPIDLAKDAGVVCTRPGARRSAIWTVKARMGTVRELGRQLKRDGIEIVTKGPPFRANGRVAAQHTDWGA
jgi:hypothetical protein